MMDGKTHIGDCLDLVKQLDNDSIDLIITSPPYYNSGHKYQRANGFHYTADVGEPLYTIEDFFEAVHPKLKQDAVVCLNLGFSYGETGVMRPYDIVDRLRRRGYFVNDQIIWHKNNPIPMRNRLTNAYEPIYVLGKTPKTHSTRPSIPTTSGRFPCPRRATGTPPPSPRRFRWSA